MKRAALALAFGASILVRLAQPAQAQQVTTSSDPDDVGSRLDIRTVSVSPAVGDRSRITIVFWNDVSRWLLTDHLVEAQMSWGEKQPTNGGIYRFHFMRTKNGLRIVSWEGGTCCPAATRAYHPDPFTYTGLTYGPVETYMPPPMWLRGITSQKVDCPRACSIDPSEVVDRTPWTHF